METTVRRLVRILLLAGSPLERQHYIYNSSSYSSTYLGARQNTIFDRNKYQYIIFVTRNTLVPGRRPVSLSHPRLPHPSFSEMSCLKASGSEMGRTSNIMYYV